MRRLAWVVVVTSLTAALAFGKDSGDIPLVVVVAKGNTGEFWQSVRAGASKAAKGEARAREPRAYLEWPSTFRQNELAGQARVVKQAVAFARREGRSFALVVDPLYGEMYADLFQAWQIDYGLPLVTFDEDVSPSGDWDGEVGRTVSFVGTDNERAGRAAGEYLAAKLNRKGSVAMLRLNPGVGTTTLREKGFLDAISRYPDICVLDANYYWVMNLDIESAYRESRTLLGELAYASCGNVDADDGKADATDFADFVESLGANRGLKRVMDEPRHKLDGIFTPNETTTVGMLRALEEANLAGEITFVGFDHNALLANALLLNKITGLIVQDPYAMGQRSVERALELLALGPDEIKRRAKHGEPVKPEFTRFALADREELEVCRARVQQGGSKEFEKQIAELMARSSILKSFLKTKDAAGAPVHGPCNTQMLELLFPDPVIWHLQSPGARS
jgi:ribose transport system substrate-binding protein